MQRPRLPLQLAATATIVVAAGGTVALVHARGGGRATVTATQASAVVTTARPASQATAAKAKPAPAKPKAKKPKPAPVTPTASDLTRATKWIATRKGHTSYAVVDSAGHLHGVRVHDRFHSASLIKVMLLTTYLRRLDAEHKPLTGDARDTLDAMIHVSDNDAASDVFGIVGESGLSALARRVGMTDFSPNPAWGLSEISAADQARLFWQLDALLPKQFRVYARHLLSGIEADQSWGIPAAGRRAGFRVLFKGGWLWNIVNQGARLERSGRTFSLAVLTDGNPSMPYGEHTLEGVTERLADG